MSPGRKGGREMTESIKMIEFGPGGQRVVEVAIPPALAVEPTPDEITWGEIGIAWAAVVIASVALVKWLLWPMAHRAIALLGW